MEQIRLCNIPCTFYRLHELYLLPDVVRPKITVLDEQGKLYNPDNEMGVAMLPNGRLVWIDQMMNIGQDGWDTIKHYLAEHYFQRSQHDYWQKQRDKLHEELANFNSSHDDVTDSFCYMFGRMRYGVNDRQSAVSYLVQP